MELIGAPFRFQGRDPETGLDCVGVARHALRDLTNIPLPDFRYSLRGPGRSTCRAWAEKAGLTALASDSIVLPGDILCVAPGPGQHHLMVAVDQGFVHAHYSIGKVVLWPDHQDWPLVAHWRLDPIHIH
ncbi:NlpC/P60 family protein [Alterisphingorhabdus coralli]|uniref:NlpC/P60 family protein n=1 Tax=Alterisphingorhabdus coralli TaxID=3071408 RepID=A0AA97F9T7_9SPHN|nr:NlpC/P60 family protein [Parasphingorhabdus sp. SCSIO 66989]WOE75687.1 NlpC/P60 family protein [Parasphingorhabdus sp. SCSIO 66989]